MPPTMALIREGIKKVPVLRYAFGLAVIAACLQLAIGAVGGNTKLLVLGVPATICVMILLFLLARLAAINTALILLPLKLLVWATTLAFIVALAAGLSAVIFGSPKALHDFMFPPLPTKTTQIDRKILAQIYFQTEKPGTERIKEGPFAGQFPQPPFSEISRADAEVVPGESYWIRPANQMIPAETPCPLGQPSAGSACSLDAFGRLAAYVRESCGEAPVLGNKISRGCSRAAPLFDPFHPRAPIVQCCFYEDSPAARGLPFNHHLADWNQLELSEKAAAKATPSS